MKYPKCLPITALLPLMRLIRCVWMGVKGTAAEMEMTC